MFALLDPATTTGQAGDLLAQTQKQLGRTPNLYRAMANSPAALAGYLAFRDQLQHGVLDVRMRERIALLTAQLNHCDYCVAAHVFRGQKIGMSADDLNDTRHGRSTDPRIHAALTFVAAQLNGRGHAEAAARDALFAQGWSEAEAGEIVAHVALNVLSNYFKQLAEPALDFPVPPDLLP
ncbi:alkylhydroperoxidase AhpD family core domain-containing protein [Andreprevotia lacus DSM 23236]|jgi:AhpD family alkylhydroperoxidase|uniref:Alkylhydroperoxidase AhpD family core domain-containing protein n=1 Tax=Andreprevotia lacus DSM 23236 TaxID=1121001 RepID=A0A1W1XSH6_9NEIS|nr:carboxymuconolactone decarboxylase family protein [Andreprevotia lacus]SMC26814.1 alkylhydroperoxidase AhpD family core domain-containing protein [Andreprevotia lacus DSM 23236]